MEHEQILAMIRAVSESGLTSFSYEENGTIIKMKVQKTAPDTLPQQAGTVAPAVAKQAAVQNIPVAVVPEQGMAPNLAAAEEENFIKSPLVGTFYAAPSPEEAPFVKIGDHVSKGQVLGIIEAMKLMNEIESEKDGVVKSILVKNKDVVEFGQPLFIIE